MNRVILIGRLTKDPEVRYGGANNTAIARFNLAVDRRFKREGDEQTADFIGCIAFGKTAEFIEKYAKKGTKLVCEGRIQTGKYEKDGQTIYTTDIVVENCEFAESKKTDTVAESKPIVPNASLDGFINVPDGIDEELPFN